MTKQVIESQQQSLAERSQPCISVFLPFDPKMTPKSELRDMLQLVYEKIENDLLTGYTSEKALPASRRLKSVIGNLDYTTYKISVAIFITPESEKVYYLDFPVQFKVVVSPSCLVRDLVNSKKDCQKYLVLLLSAKESRIYLGSSGSFKRIVSNVPQHVAAYRNEISEPIGIFSDPSHRKEVMLEKFLRHIDNGLGFILKSYPLPLFVMGAERTTGHFKKLSHNTARIAGCVHGNFESATEPEIRNALAPHIADWNKVRQQDILLQIDSAVNQGKLISGISPVWDEASNRTGRLLVVEKDFISPTLYSSQLGPVFPQEVINGKSYYARDAVDEIIGKVLESGGDVEFVEPGLLENYNRIALIKYY